MGTLKAISTVRNKGSHDEKIKNLLDRAIDIDQLIILEIENIHSSLSRQFPSLGKSFDAIFDGAMENAELLRQVALEVVPIDEDAEFD